MKKTYLLFALLLVTGITLSQTYQWVKHSTLPITSNPDLALFPCASDQSGNIIFGSLDIYRTNFGSTYFGDIILKKYNNTGTVILSKIMKGKVSLSAIETDASGSIYLAGTFMDTIEIETGNLLINTNPGGLTLNSFLIKLNSSGGFLWKKNITAIYGTGAASNGFKVRNNLLLVCVDQSLNSFIKKFDLNGNETQSITQTNTRQLSGVDADAAGNIYAAGSCSQGTINFGGTAVTSTFQYSLYYVKYSSAGANLYAKLVEDITFERPKIVSDASGNVYASGDLNDDFIFGAIHTQGPQWVYDFYLAKIDPSGNFLWVKEVPNSGPITGDAGIGRLSYPALDAQGNVYISGFQRSTVNWGSISTTTSITGALVLKYSPAGDLQWAKVTPNGSSKGDGICLDNSGNIFVSGNLSSTVSFDTISATGTGGVNPFLSKLSNQVTGVVNQQELPLVYSLSNYPNPFNPVTNIKFSLPISGFTTLKVYNSLGKLVTTLVNGRLDAGSYSSQWDAEENTSGVYFYTIESGSYKATGKMILLK